MLNRILSLFRKQEDVVKEKVNHDPNDPESYIEVTSDAHGNELKVNIIAFTSGDMIRYEKY